MLPDAPGRLRPRPSDLLRPAPAACLAAALVAVAALPGPSAAQHEAPPEPAAYALESVTVVRPGGPRLQGVTLVVRDGLIEALGPEVEVPDDARVLEGDSLRVYPGMVDADAGAELAWPAEDGGDGEGSGGDEEETVPWNPARSAQGFTPRRRAAEAVTATGDDLRGQRKSGVVASAVHPAEGVAPGRGVLLMHRPDAGTPRELVVDPELGLSLTFEAAGQAYPSTHFGVLAFLRQRLLDAEHRQAVLAAHRESTAGMAPPSWDPDLEALAEATSGPDPVFFRANGAQDIRQVLDLADAHGFRPVIVGGREAWKVADRLAREDVPVLVSLDFPEPRRWDPEKTEKKEEPEKRKPDGERPSGKEQPPGGAAGGEAGPPAAGEAGRQQEELAPEVLREKRRIEDARANAARLAEAGVRVALTSGQGEADLREGARTAIEYGLSEQDALRAVTSVPADVLGAPWLVRVREGHPANLVVTDGPLFGEETKVRYAFVEGEVQRGVEPGAEPEEPPAVDVSGRWEIELETSGGSFSGTLSLEQEGGQFDGTMTTQFGESKVVNGVVSGNEVSFTIVVDAGGQTLRLSFSGTASGDEMSGSGSGPPQMVGSFTWQATRTGGPGGGEG